MNAHTPGPWKIGYGGMEGDNYAVVTSPHSARAICGLEPMDYVAANARLIAAAPELLKALREMVLANTGPIDENDFHDILTGAKDAIAKAERRGMKTDSYDYERKSKESAKEHERLPIECPEEPDGPSNGTGHVATLCDDADDLGDGATEEKEMIEIKNRYTGEVLFSCIRITIAQTLAEAVGAHVNLSNSNLCCADLHGADLHGADLREAYLHNSDLRGADLRGADLRRANLHGADLCGANLRGADLCEADLCGAIDGNVCRMDFGGWSICIRNDYTQIGCKKCNNEEWLNFTPHDVKDFAEDAEQWWRIHSEAVKATIRCVIAKGVIENECNNRKQEA